MVRIARVVVPGMGEKRFLERLGRVLGRNLLPNKGGRPRKKTEN
jgi:hypothetical protein